MDAEGAGLSSLEILEWFFGGGEEVSVRGPAHGVRLVAAVSLKLRDVQC